MSVRWNLQTRIDGRAIHPMWVFSLVACSLAPAPSAGQSFADAAGLDENTLATAARFVAEQFEKDAAFADQVLRRIQQTRPSVLHNFIAESTSATGNLTELQGELTSVDSVDALAEAATADWSRAKIAQILLENGREALVLAGRVPEGVAPPQRVDAIVLLCETTEEEIIGIAARLAWRPDTPLGRLGVDVGLLEDVQDRRPLTVAERQAFYSILAAAGGAALPIEVDATPEGVGGRTAVQRAG